MPRCRDACIETRSAILSGTVDVLKIVTFILIKYNNLNIDREYSFFIMFLLQRGSE